MSLELLVEFLRNRAVDEDALGRLRHIVAPDQVEHAAACRSILQELPFDEWSFDDRFGDGAWRRVIGSLDGVGDLLPVHRPGRPEPEAKVLSFLAVLLLTVNGLKESSYRRSPEAAAPGVGGRADAGGRPRAGQARRGDRPPPAATHDCAHHCERLVADEGVVDTIFQIYYPDRPADERARPARTGGDPGPEAAWLGDVRGNRLTFHRHGTTSVILRGLGREKDGARREFALKLILYPFLRISRIEQATLGYKEWAPKARAEDVHLTRVWASSSSWILMDYVEGVPLSELFTARPGAAARANLAELRRYGTALFAALCQFDERFNHDNAGARRVHGDLSPSNIIIGGDERAPVARLIDVGRNYLYAHSAIYGAEGTEGSYIAPEVKRGDGEEEIADADLFSLGHLLILIGGAGTRPDRTVPDEFYARVPMIARFIEDLIEHDPRNRLLLFASAETDGHRRYQVLYEQFLAEVDAAQAAEDSNRAPTDERWFRGLLALLRYRLPEALRPMGGMPGRLLRIRNSRRRSGSGSASSSRSLLFWSWLSATAWAVTVSVTITWFLRQLNWSGSPWQWGTRSVEVYQKAANPDQDNLIPIIDDLRRADYPFPDLAHNWPALLVGFTYILVGAKYYQNLFAGISPMRAGWRAGRLTAWAAAAQFFMRLETVAACLLVLPAVLIEPRWWPINTAIGQILVYLCNGSAYSFALTAIHRARERGLATASKEDSAITGVSAFSEWVPTSLFYAVTVTAIGTLIYLDKLHDLWMYALAASSINFFLFYIIKCGRGAAEVRVLLTRATFAAERLRRMDEAQERRARPAPAAPKARPAVNEPVASRNGAR